MIRFAENLNKMIAAGLGGAMEAPRTEVAVGHRLRYMEASGAVASFETNIAAPIRSLSISMSPIQDLHGQDAPYPAGGGKNVLPTYTADETKNGVTLKVNADWTVTLNGTATATTTFTAPVGDFKWDGETPYWISGCPTGGDYNASYSLRVDGGNNSYSYPDTGNGAALQKYYSSEQLPLFGVKLRFCIVIRSGTVCSNLTFKPMLNAGSSAEPFQPYENICPISGRESVTVWREASYDPSADPALTIPLGQTVYGGTLDISTGKLTVTHGEIASYDGEALPGEWISDRDVYAAGTTPTIGAQVVYVLDTPQTIDLDPQQITTLKGDNNVWSDAGDVTLEYSYYEETEGY